MAKPARDRSKEDASPAEKTPAVAAAPAPGGADKPTLWRALTPTILLDSTPAEWLFSLPFRWRHSLLLIAFAMLVFFPYLGAVGFWDPWEVHYGEVARSMIVRQDFIRPYWESAYFFSKPVLTLWISALGMLIAGTDNPERGTSVYTEWCVRTLFAMIAVAGVVMVYQAVSRTLSRRGGIWAAVILATCPIYFILARQAVPDMPFVVIVTAANACLMIAVFEKEEVQDGWLYAFYALAGLGVLAKGFLTIAIPGASMLLYFVFSGDWRLIPRLRIPTGALIALAMFAPWVGYMSWFPGKDDESNTFAYRFFIHDQFKRLGVDPTKMEFVAGVHTTTPMGYNVTFVYFMEQLGFGLAPWVALIPGAFASFFTAPGLTDVKTRQARAKLFVVCWLLITYTVFAYAATKFHHYDFPMVPPIAILLGLYMADVLDQGVSKHAVALFAGVVLFGTVAQNLAMEPKHFTDMFVYNYDRPYPAHEVDQVIHFTIPRLALGSFSRGPWPITTPVIFGFLFALMPLGMLLGVTEIRRWFVALLKPFGVKRTVTEEPSDRLYVMGSMTIVAVCFAIFFSSYHWRKLSPEWSQRDLFWEYNHQSAADEPIGAYQMNWRGETFYSRNLVRQLKEAGELKDYVAQPGRQWLLVEQARFAGMKSTIGSGFDVKVIDKTNNKFVLVVIEKNKPAASSATL